MSPHLQVGIWDHDPERAGRMLLLLESVFRKQRLNASVVVNCEPPQVSRSNLNGRFPSLEIAGQYWTLIPEQDFTEAQLIRLFQHLAEGGIVLCRNG